MTLKVIHLLLYNSKSINMYIHVYLCQGKINFISQEFVVMKGCTSDKERKERKKELLCDRINLLSNCTIFGKEAVLHT